VENINLFLVFVEGLLSFLSPCIVPILPVYISILSNSSTEELQQRKVRFFKTALFRNTILFILGISSTFFILGTSINAFSRFFISNKDGIIRIGGVIIVLMGLFYMEVINIPFLQRERRFQIDTKNMNPITAFILGLTFSFGWTPCIGPMLASVLIMSSSTTSQLTGNLMILAYTIGFTLPFIIIAAFYEYMIVYLNKVKRHMSKIKKIGGIILIISGMIMIFGGADKVRGYIEDIFTKPSKVSEEKLETSDINNDDQYTPNIKPGGNTSNEALEENIPEKSPIEAPDFTLVDQYGKTHKLSDYKGKTVFLNFWATWCPPCLMEMPHIEEIYKQYNKNKDDVIILGVATPGIGREGTKEEIVKFLKDKGYTFPVVFDSSTKLLEEYFIGAFPTTYIIDKEGRFINYIPGAMDKGTMESVIKEAQKDN